MKKYWTILGILFAIIVLLSVTCTKTRNEGNNSGGPGGRAVVRVGYLRLLSAAPLYTAVREGYFDQEGINVELRVIKSGPEGNEALAAGNIDVAFSILPSLITAYDSGVPSDVVSIYGASIDGPKIRDHRIIVANTSDLARVDQLRGKKIGVVGWPGMTSDGLELWDHLERHNMTVNDVTLVGMAHGDMIANLQSGVIDAAAAAEPYITSGILQGVVKTLSEEEGFYYQMTSETEVTTYLARRAWVDANLELARKFVRALDQGRQKSSDREWLTKFGLPFFNKKATASIDFVELTPEQSGQLRLMPINALPSKEGLTHVTQQLVKRGKVKKTPSDSDGLVLPLMKTN
jgi:ABC-type nitrate/sulfonate/bicarbonate transport system substrate-binding protein